MRKTQIIKLAMATGAAVALSGCDTVKNTLGLNHYQADEWNVPTTRPLDMPPDYNLMPPRPGASSPHVVSPSALAEKKIGAPGAIETTNESEKNFLSQAAGSTQADPNIRETVNQEALAEESVMERVKNMAKQAKDNLTGNTPGPRDTHKNPAETR